MVNQTIYTYLKNYKDKFSVVELKTEILKKGYDEVEFNEALSQVNIDIEAQRKSEIKAPEVKSVAQVQKATQVQKTAEIQKLPTFESVKQKSGGNSGTLIWIIILILIFDVVLFFGLNYFGFDFFGLNLFG